MLSSPKQDRTGRFGTGRDGMGRGGTGQDRTGRERDRTGQLWYLLLLEAEVLWYLLLLTPLSCHSLSCQQVAAAAAAATAAAAAAARVEAEVRKSRLSRREYRGR